jgi:hypothetical protein
MSNRQGYENPKIEVWIVEDDIIVSSTPFEDDYDDKGSWKDTWFKGPEN